MNTLQRGSHGDEVSAWQTFLCGQGLYVGNVDGDFGPLTESATKDFQIRYSVDSIDPTGSFDAPTQEKASLLGFELCADPNEDQTGPNWPKSPDDLKPLSADGRAKLFGKFKFAAAPSVGNPEGILVDRAWSQANIVQVHIKQLNRSVAFHALGVAKLQALFDAWEVDGLLSRVESWDGSYAPRFIRGSRTTLSAHAWGSAFDINAMHNQLGAVPALFGKKGCVRELVLRANELGFYWGGHFPGRKDGMHFELVNLTVAI